MTQPITPAPAASTIRRRSIVVPTGAAPTTPAPSAEFLPPGVTRNPIGAAATPQPEPPQASPAPAAPTEEPEPIAQGAALPERVAAEAASIDPKPVAAPASPKGRGNRFGPGGLPQDKRDEIIALAKAGKNASEISAQIGIGRLTVTKYMPKAAKPSGAQAAPAAPAPRAKRTRRKAAPKPNPKALRTQAKRTAHAKPVGAPTPDLAVLFAQLLRDKKVDADTALRVVPAVELVNALI